MSCSGRAVAADKFAVGSTGEPSTFAAGVSNSPPFLKTKLTVPSARAVSLQRGLQQHHPAQL